MQVPPDLVRSARHGDPLAQEALALEVWPHAYRICLSTLQREALALEAAQEATAHALQHLPRLRDPAAFPAWFYRICLNAAYTLAREERRQSDPKGGAIGTPRDEAASSHGPSADPLEPAKARTGLLEDPMAEVDRRLDLTRAVASLREPFRTTFLLSYHAHLTSRELGQVLGIPPGTVRYRLTVARTLLIEALAEPSGTETSAGDPKACEPAAPTATQGGVYP